MHSVLFKTMKLEQTYKNCVFFKHIKGINTRGLDIEHDKNKSNKKHQNH